MEACLHGVECSAGVDSLVCVRVVVFFCLPTAVWGMTGGEYGLGEHVMVGLGFFCRDATQRFVRGLMEQKLDQSALLYCAVVFPRSHCKIWGNFKEVWYQILFFPGAGKRSRSHEVKIYFPSDPVSFFSLGSGCTKVDALLLGYRCAARHHQEITRVAQTLEMTPPISENGTHTITSSAGEACLDFSWLCVTEGGCRCTLSNLISEIIVCLISLFPALQVGDGVHCHPIPSVSA